MPKVSEEHRISRRKEILNAAVVLFARNGFDGTSMADIIAESGLSAGAIYGHFKSKADLVQSSVEDIFVQRQTELEEMLASDIVLSPAAVLTRLLQGMREEIESPALLLQLWAAANREPELHRLATGLADHLIDVLSQYFAAWYRENGRIEGEAEARARRLAPLCLGIAQGYMIQASLIDGFDGKAYIAAIPELLGEH
ncbi:TetR/AcrR family transcriptional regulator [Microterricola viridarii]|uniref:DNA-binding transcriptional regulator, AcrR family n=1 Tax=Microterricola viridarii TaxID=412690 RepID=A0A1H1Y6K5_9MICO|nr:TetR/AcrR family transcriptional regulator [Microterricola viridarii]SDT17063.1 DNA-binding transcriptional regulator, AcrR family [Microterricola viridarii]